MEAIWKGHFLTPARAAHACLVVGEWGGRYLGSDEMWQDRFKAFLLENRLDSFYWALNPNSGEYADRGDPNPRPSPPIEPPGSRFRKVSISLIRRVAVSGPAPSLHTTPRLSPHQ